MTNETNELQKATPRKTRSGWRTLGLVTCLVLIVVIAASGIVAFIVRQRGSQIGFDVVNVVTFFLIALAAVCTALVVLILILLQTDKTFRQKLTAVSILVLLVCSGVLGLRYSVQFVGFSGRLVPILRWRWGHAPEPLDEKPRDLASTSIDLATTGPGDFPQFLGPDRDLTVSGVTLERDWEVASSRAIVASRRRCGMERVQRRQQLCINA